MLKYCERCNTTVNTEENYCIKCKYPLKKIQKENDKIIKRYNLVHNIIGIISIILISAIIAMLFIKPIISLVLFIIFILLHSHKSKFISNIDREYSEFLRTDIGQIYIKQQQERIEQIQEEMQQNKMLSPKYQANQRIEENKKNAVACCPKCGSTSLSTNKKGYGVVKGALGVGLAPTGLIGTAIGLSAGNIGKNNIIITCLNCGHKFKPGK